jgi:hypothetical protein
MVVDVVENATRLVFNGCVASVSSENCDPSPGVEVISVLILRSHELLLLLKT